MVVPLCNLWNLCNYGSEMTNFSDNLRLIIDESDCATISQFAAHVGIERSRLSGLKNGRLTPKHRDIRNIAKHCGIDASDLQLDHQEFAEILLGSELLPDVWTGFRVN